MTSLLKDLIDGVSVVRAAYSKAYPNQGNPDRERLIDILETLRDLIAGNPQLSDQEKIELLVATALTCINEIERTTTFPSRSILYCALQTYLASYLSSIAIKNNENIPAREQYVPLAKLYNFVFTHENNIPTNVADGILNDLFQRDLIRAMRSALSILQPDIYRISNAFPVESEINQSLSKIVADYLTRVKEKNKNPNPDRIFYAQLLEAVCAVTNDVQSAVKNKKGDGSFAYMVKVGTALFAAQLIYNTYKTYSPHAHSDLFDLICEALHIKNFKNLEHETKLLYLHAAKSFIENIGELIPLLEQFGAEKFGKDNLLRAKNLKLWQLPQELNEVMDKLYGKITSDWSVVKILTLVTASLVAPAAYGIGAASAEMAAYSKIAEGPKRLLANFIDKMGSWCYGGNLYGSFGNLMSNRIAEYSLERGLGKGGEALAIGGVYMAGALTGKVVDAATAYPLQAFHALCRQTLQSKSLEPEDKELVQAFLDSPPEVFTAKEKEKIVATASKLGMFSTPPGVPVQAGANLAPNLPNRSALN